MKQKFLFNVEVFPMINRKTLCVEQLIPDYDNGFQEEVIVTCSDFAEAVATLQRHFQGYINKYFVRSMVSEVVK